MIKSELRQGLIYAGATRLALSIAVEQTGPMQLTVRAGAYTETNGNTFRLAEDTIFNLTSDSASKKYYRIQLGVRADGSVGVIARSRLSTDPYPRNPIGWQRLLSLVLYGSSEYGEWGDLLLPPGLSDLASIDIFVITTKAGFPPK